MACIRIEREANGYTVSVTDPKIVAENNKRDTKGDRVYAPWKDPCKTYIFKNVKEVTDFVTKNINKALPADDYSSAFDTAVAAPSED